MVVYVWIHDLALGPGVHRDLKWTAHLPVTRDNKQSDVQTEINFPQREAAFTAVCTPVET